MSESLLQCYNKGCGLKFTPNKIDEEECCYHPGAPIFHDAYKGWSCCNKKSTDFTTFLNTKGCTKGKHNIEKPIEPEKQKSDPSKRDEVIVVKPSNQMEVIRPDFNSEMARLKVSVSQSLKSALNKNISNVGGNEVDENEYVLGLKIGESCKNNGCKETFQGEESNLGICKYHPGYPIFHEGMKYWYCCQRKTSDFDIFLQQEGCTTGSHLWVKKNLKKTSCRFDWHQTPTHVFVTIYAKVAQPELSYVDVNAVRLCCHIVFEDENEFDLDHELGGVIHIQESTVSMAATKVEIKLKKDSAHHWNRLFFIKSKEEIKSEDEIRDENESLDLNSRVDAVDLSDI